jgi:hypothetical protein
MLASASNISSHYLTDQLLAASKISQLSVNWCDEHFKVLVLATLFHYHKLT